MTVDKTLDKSENLPLWDLSDFYDGINSPDIENDLHAVQEKALAFASTYQEKFTEGQAWDAALLLKAIQEFEALETLMGKLMSYAYLTFATQMNDAKIVQFYQSIHDKLTQYSTPLIFFGLDLNKLSDASLEKAYDAEPELARYRPWLDGERLFKNHQLSAELEKLLHEKSISSRQAWIRLFDETLASLVFDLGGKSASLSEVLNGLSHPSASIRRDSALALSKGLTSRVQVLALVTNTLAKDKEIEDTWRNYDHPVASRNLSNRVEDEVVEALNLAVQNHYERLSHRYYALKAKWMGQEHLEYWDRNAPLPEAAEHHISWEEAKEIVRHAYREFSPTLADIGERFFDNNWIHVPPAEGKDSGAFAHPTIPAVHPYLMLNHHGKMRDVMTLAHELGHGIHQVLASDQGYLLSHTPLTIAETASVFGEMLTFRALLKREQSALERRSLLAGKVEDMLNTVVRQIAFFNFEKQVHERRRLGELTPDDLSAIWMETQEKALGPSVKLDPAVGVYWGYISHFIHSPFYVYAYSFGDCLVNSLYSVYESGQFSDFEEKYIELLKAGGSKLYPELLAPFGLDAKAPSFWEKGLSMIEGFIDELENM